MAFTDNDLKQLKTELDQLAGLSLDAKLLDVQAIVLIALLGRLEAAELALEDADCNCRGDNTEHELVEVCRFFRRKAAWRKAAGK